MMPFSFSVSWKVVFTLTLSNTTSTATPARRFCSCSEMPSFSKVLISSGSASSRLLSVGFFLGAL